MKKLINATIYKSEKQAILIEDNKILIVGMNEDILQQISDNDEVIDLNGMFVLPGFVDSHMHLAGLGFYLSCVQLATCTSLEDMKERLLARLSTLKQGQWLIARGYNEETFTDAKVKPTKDF